MESKIWVTVSSYRSVMNEKLNSSLILGVCGFHFLTRALCADFRLCLSRRAVVIIRRRRKEINDEPSLNNSRQPRRPLASPRINLNFLVMVSLPFRIC